jgi:hypothetical protein
MDNEVLNAILSDAHNRKFWVVLWGDPTHSPDEDAQLFDNQFYDQGLTRDVRNMKVGDILFVHRIKISKIIFVGEVVAEPRKSSLDESEKEEWRKKWTWSVALRNLTPTYGLQWRKRGQRTFTLKDQYNELNPQSPVNIGRLQRGSHVQIPVAFAKFLLNEIIQFD